MTLVKNASLIIHSARQVVTCASQGKVKRKAALQDVGAIENGAVVITDGIITAVGSTPDILGAYTARQTVDASGKVLCPGFVDCHTHTVYAGDRVAEFEQRIAGVSYMDILAAGGGILNTMRATRLASQEVLVEAASRRLTSMLRLGTTTVEIKTGYGLDMPSELKMLNVIESLAEHHVVDIVPTFLGAHAVPPEYKSRGNQYAALVAHEMLPQAAQWYKQSSFAAQGCLFSVDVFCEDGAFDIAQSQLVLEAGQALDMSIKMHVDEFKALGGLTLAVGLGALSVDHLDVSRSEEIDMLAQSNTVGVIMPAVNFHLGSTHFADARSMIDAGAAIALATDLNPGSAPCYSMPLVMALACRYQKVLPAEAMNASTINAAHALGLGDSIGSLEAGKQADILILDAPDYRHLMYQLGGNLVETVIKRGVII
ncbi:MAG: imidazolonepropionase [Anaerolineae bacterium]